MKLLVCGSRGFDDYNEFSNKLDEYLSATDLSKVEIVSGGARGADTFAEQYAHERGIQFTKFPANWDKHGRSAGYIRNAEMAKYCSGATNTTIAFWDGKSLGTKHMIKTALNEGMSVVKVIIKDPNDR